MRFQVSDLVGIPYKMHGRDENGLDCFGLIWLIAKRNGTSIPDPWYRGFDSSLIKLAAQMSVEKIESLEPGCVIEMEKDGRMHLGYALDCENMIHATHNEGVIVENIVNYTAIGYYRFNGNG